MFHVVFYKRHTSHEQRIHTSIPQSNNTKQEALGRTKVKVTLRLTVNQ
jgi:hypothetical protein